MTDIFCSKCVRVPDELQVIYHVVTNIKPTTLFDVDSVEKLIETFDGYFEDGTVIESEPIIVRSVRCGECEHIIYEE